MRPKNWESFQHYKNRRPPWIKLHRAILDDADIHALDGEDFKHLAMIWIIASEHETGELPTLAKLAFRLRMTLRDAEQLVIRLQAWLEIDASKPSATCQQIATPETEGETEESREEGDAREAPPSNSDPEQIPDGLEPAQYADGLMELMRISKRSAYAVFAALVDVLPMLAQDEHCSLGEAARRMLARMRAAERDGPVKWRFWLGEEGGWKRRAESGAAIGSWDGQASEPGGLRSTVSDEYFAGIARAKQAGETLSEFDEAVWRDTERQNQPA